MQTKINIKVSCSSLPERANACVHDTSLLFKSNLLDPLEQVRRFRGPVLHAHCMASVCTGAGPESQIDNVLEVQTRHFFTCDIKATAFRWIEANGPASEHHFVDVREMACSIEQLLNGKIRIQARCARHGMQICTVDITPGELHMLTAGISCKPFSNARTGRRSGTTAHRDEDLFQHCIRLVKALQPGILLLENVHGIIFPESKLNKSSPLNRFLKAFKDENPLYHVIVFVVTGKLWLVQSRKRVYVAFFHERVGGSHAAFLAKRFMTDRATTTQTHTRAPTHKHIKHTHIESTTSNQHRNSLFDVQHSHRPQPTRSCCPTATHACRP